MAVLAFPIKRPERHKERKVLPAALAAVPKAGEYQKSCLPSDNQHCAYDDDENGTDRGVNRCKCEEYSC